jgi:hypothetical protein
MEKHTVRAMSHDSIELAPLAQTESRSDVEASTALLLINHDTAQREALAAVKFNAHQARIKWGVGVSIFLVLVVYAFASGRANIDPQPDDISPSSVRTLAPTQFGRVGHPTKGTLNDPSDESFSISTSKVFIRGQVACISTAPMAVGQLVSAQTLGPAMPECLVYLYTDGSVVTNPSIISGAMDRVCAPRILPPLACH